MFQAGMCCSMLAVSFWGCRNLNKPHASPGDVVALQSKTLWSCSGPCGHARAAAVKCPAVALRATSATVWGAPALCHHPSLPLWLTVPRAAHELLTSSRDRPGILCEIR